MSDHGISVTSDVIVDEPSKRPTSGSCLSRRSESRLGDASARSPKNRPLRIAPNERRPSASTRNTSGPIRPHLGPFRRSRFRPPSKPQKFPGLRISPITKPFSGSSSGNFRRAAELAPIFRRAHDRPRLPSRQKTDLPGSLLTSADRSPRPRSHWPDHEARRAAIESFAAPVPNVR
jgi:hypothetical protein